MARLLPSVTTGSAAADPMETEPQVDAPVAPSADVMKRLAQLEEKLGEVAKRAAAADERAAALEAELAAFKTLALEGKLAPPQGPTAVQPTPPSTADADGTSSTEEGEVA